ncbi:MAG: lysophospholipid acyltransferase family protein, partial [Candidatus Acidiferrales bacterium]
MAGNPQRCGTRAVPLYYTPMEEEAKSAEETAQSTRHFDARQPKYSLWRRMQIRAIAIAVVGMVRTIGPTLRYEVLGWQHAERAYAAGGRCIWVFWHQAILGVLWWGRGRGVVILNSTNFDGQWAERVIKRFGYGTAHGSSTRGGLRGLNEMAERLNEGRDAGFTIDGPRGPRFVAKQGPVMLARQSGQAIFPFHVVYERAKTFEKTWDHFRVPRPFTRVLMVFTPPIVVPPDADRATVEAKQAELQAALDRAREFGESWFQLSPAEQALERE